MCVVDRAADQADQVVGAMEYGIAMLFLPKILDLIVRKDILRAMLTIIIKILKPLTQI